MKIEIHKSEELAEPLLELHYPASYERDPHKAHELKRLLAQIAALDDQITAYEPASSTKHTLKLHEIDLIELNEAGRVDVYCANGTRYESTKKLHELDALLAGRNFARVSRQALVNIQAIERIEPRLYGRLELGLRSGEDCIVSRTYAQNLKEEIGLS